MHHITFRVTVFGSKNIRQNDLPQAHHTIPSTANVYKLYHHALLRNSVASSARANKHKKASSTGTHRRQKLDEDGYDSESQGPSKPEWQRRSPSALLQAEDCQGSARGSAGNLRMTEERPRDKGGKEVSEGKKGGR